jgi:hypothetical protein
VRLTDANSRTWRRLDATGGGLLLYPSASEDDGIGQCGG